MEDILIGHALADESYVIRCVDPNFCDITGFEPEDVVGRNLFDITHPDDREVQDAAMATLISEDRPYRIDKRYLRQDGATIAVRSHVSLFRPEDDAPPLLVAAIQPRPLTVRSLGDCVRTETVYQALDRLAENHRNPQ